MKKTKQEIEKLKDDWLEDPCWEIEETEGFEEHRLELLEFSLKIKKTIDEQEERRIKRRMGELGCSRELIYYLESLEAKIEGR